jgi:cardiolipin synthase
VSALWPYLLLAFHVTISVVASGHAVLFKRDSRSALGWVAIIWALPTGGAILYALLGVNRIQTRARALRRAAAAELPTSVLERTEPDEVACELGESQLEAIGRVVGSVVQAPLLSGNQVTLLEAGEAAFPAMLEAIDGAEKSVLLQTYIFDNDPTGLEFVEALARAKARGVEVRVLIDGVGARYTWPSVVGVLKKAGIPTARFLPTTAPLRLPFMNLRSHRKLLLIDGRTGFTGGMNIREGHRLERAEKHLVRDLQARVEGPVMAQLREVSFSDWRFAARESLEGEIWRPTLAPVGKTVARGIPDGPDGDYDSLRLTYLGAIQAARRSIRIVTPYFVPDQVLLTALGVAAMQGIRVDIVLPEKSNLSTVHWATFAQLWQVVERGCRVYLSPPPFDHSKLMLVDDSWVLLGSGNWDARSLRLNFELNLECYDRELAERVDAAIEMRLENAREVSLAELDGRPLPIRLRDGIARLMAPYL